MTLNRHTLDWYVGNKASPRFNNRTVPSHYTSSSSGWQVMCFVNVINDAIIEDNPQSVNLEIFHVIPYTILYMTTVTIAYVSVCTA